MKTLILLLALLAVPAGAQWKKSGGKQVPADSTVTVKVKVMEAESTLTVQGRSVAGALDSLSQGLFNSGVQYFAFAPFYVDGATGQAWGGADSLINFFPFNLHGSLVPDSAGVYVLSALSSAAADSFRFAIYSYSGTLLCETGWKKTSGTSAQRVMAAFTSNPTLVQGSYIMAYSHTRWNVTAIPSLNVVVHTNAPFYQMTTGAGGTRRIGTIGNVATASGFPSTLSSGGAFSPSNVPVITLIGR